MRAGRRTRARRVDVDRLKPELDRLYAAFDHPEATADPIEVARRYAAPADREIAAFVAASLAFGRVASVLQSIERLLAVMGPSPAAFIARYDACRDQGRFDTLGHRWARGQDLAALVLIIKGMVDRCGSIEEFFLKGYDAAAPDIGPALEAFSTSALDLAPGASSGTAGGRFNAPPPQRGRRVGELGTGAPLDGVRGASSGSRKDLGAPLASPYEGEGRPGVRYFFPRPSSGSACKRLNLFLRWMVRKDGIDFGLWTRVAPSKLIIPLDTHVIRVSRCLRLTTCATPGWRMAAEITASLRQIDPDDPVKYDFSLCHIGMMDACGFNRPYRDQHCPLRGLCRPGARRPRASLRPSSRH